MSDRSGAVAELAVTHLWLHVPVGTRSCAQQIRARISVRSRFVVPSAPPDPAPSVSPAVAFPCCPVSRSTAASPDAARTLRGVVALGCGGGWPGSSASRLRCFGHRPRRCPYGGRLVRVRSPGCFDSILCPSSYTICLL